MYIALLWLYYSSIFTWHTQHITQLDTSGLKLSRSSTDINEKPVTAEDLDKVLKGLAKFRELEIR